MVNKVQVFGDYQLMHPLDCDVDIMGKEFEIHIGGSVGKILFPKLSPKFLEYQASGKLKDNGWDIPGPICPKDIWPSTNEEDGLGYTHWGATKSFPKGDCLIKSVMLEFYLSKNESETNMHNIYNCIDTWFERFYDIYEIVLMSPVHDKKKKSNHNGNLTLYSLDANSGKLDPFFDENYESLHIKVNFLRGTLKSDKMEKLVDLTNKHKDIAFEYKCFLEGFRAYYQEDYKKAVTICSPALESALLKGIMSFSKSKKIYFINNILKKYKMLGGYFALAEDIKMNLPTKDYYKSILTLRNDVIHQGYSPTKEEVEKYISDVKKYLDTFTNGILER